MPDTLPLASTFSPLTPASEDRRVGQSRGEQRADAVLAWIERHWTKLVWSAGLLVTTCGLVTHTLGVQVTGPAEANAAQARRDTAIATRVSNLEARMQRAEDAQQFQGFLSCVILREVNPAAVPPGCTPLERKQGAP